MCCLGPPDTCKLHRRMKIKCETKLFPPTNPALLKCKGLWHTELFNKKPRSMKAIQLQYFSPTQFNVCIPQQGKMHSTKALCMPCWTQDEACRTLFFGILYQMPILPVASACNDSGSSQSFSAIPYRYVFSRSNKAIKLQPRSMRTIIQTNDANC